jgi:hypothetical protein
VGVDVGWLLVIRLPLAHSLWCSPPAVLTFPGLVSYSVLVVMELQTGESLPSITTFAGRVGAALGRMTRRRRPFVLIRAALEGHWSVCLIRLNIVHAQAC